MCRKIAIWQVSGTEVAQNRVTQLIGILPSRTHKGRYKACLVTWKKKCYTLRNNKEHHLQLPRSQMKWRIILPNLAGDGGFQGTSLPTCSIIFCFTLPRLGVQELGWPAGQWRVRGRPWGRVPWQQKQAVLQRISIFPAPKQPRASPRFRPVTSTWL